jgi:hypothetical protein
MQHADHLVDLEKILVVFERAAPPAAVKRVDVGHATLRGQGNGVAADGHVV